jgi:prepilin-type processing-associated H-X9-DG protein
MHRMLSLAVTKDDGGVTETGPFSFRGWPMNRVRFEIVFPALFVLLLLTNTGTTAPAAKDKKSDEPLGPISQEQLDKSANNLKQIALAFHNYEATNGKMATNQPARDGKPGLSWRVQVLPYIEQDDLYKQFKLDEPWDSENNKKLIEKIPDLFVPVRGKAERGQTFYQTFTGKHGWMNAGATLPGSFPDGTSNTFLVAEAARPVIWSKPDDLEFDGTPVPKLGGMFDGRFTVAFADGHVQRFKKDVDKDLLKILIDPADGMVIPDLGGVTDADEEKK